MTKIIKNGVIDSRSMSDYVYNANIEQSIIDLNKLWNQYEFSIYTYMRLMDRHGSEWFRTDSYTFLKTFDFKSWREISSNMREAMAIVIVNSLACPAIGYDADSQKFVDFRIEGSATRVGPQALPAPDSNADVAVEAHHSKFRAILSSMFRIFRKTK